MALKGGGGVDLFPFWLVSLDYLRLDGSGIGEKVAIVQQDSSANRLNTVECDAKASHDTRIESDYR